MLKNTVAVIGGGPAGMMAAHTAASDGANVTLLEKNEKLGKKLYLTGKGRCNLTNATDIEGLLTHVVRNPRFLYGAFHALDAVGLMAFFEALGVPLKVERGNRVFPVSDKANDINRALEAQLGQCGVRVRLRTAVEGVSWNSPRFTVRTTRGPVEADALILATGGLSYPATGATGEGFSFAEALGHTVTPTYPSLVPLVVDAAWLRALEGLSLRNVRLVAKMPTGKVLYEETGEMLFTGTGVSGPLALRAAAFLTDKLGDAPTLTLDMKPGLDAAALDARVLRDFADAPNKDFANALGALLPARMITAVVTLCEIPPETKVNAITKAQRAALVHTLKNIPLTPTATAGYKEAIITRGGINTREINPATLMSKLIPGLFFAGECIDTDALTGGYNLQIAFSTGYLAGMSAGRYVRRLYAFPFCCCH